VVARKLVLHPFLEGRVALRGIGRVVESEHLSALGVSQHQLADALEGRQLCAASATGRHECDEVAVLTPGAVAVVVTDRAAWVQRIDEREVQLPAVRQSSEGSPLADAIEVVPDRLIGDEKAQVATVSPARQDREQCGAVALSTLVRERIERVFSQGP
jgi:hypothetical protein